MKSRRQLSQSQANRRWKSGGHVKSKNFPPTIMRGGYRL